MNHIILPGHSNDSLLVFPLPLREQENGGDLRDLWVGGGERRERKGIHVDPSERETDTVG